ncbi:MAG: hypothetical protein JOY58_18875 [Solirubrobacterales bacterium]|nr:hypothetical protein [Solirubrobacterales bacterium]
MPTGTSYAVPANGVLTSWDVQGPPAPHDDPIDFKVFRPTGPAHTYQMITQSGLQTVSGPGLHSFPFRLSVRTGDVIGFYSDSNSGWCGDFVRGAQHDLFDNVDVPLGQTTAFTPTPGSDFRADIAATIEPDRDGDGFGDISQDQCPTDPSRQSPCPAPPASAGGPATAALPATAAPPATAASISKVSQSAGKWRAGGRLAVISRARRPPVGTTFRFTLDKAATVQFAFSQKKPGRTVGQSCLPRTRTDPVPGLHAGIAGRLNATSEHPPLRHPARGIAIRDVGQSSEHLADVAGPVVDASQQCSRLKSNDWSVKNCSNMLLHRWVDRSLWRIECAGCAGVTARSCSRRSR